ncbi:MAG: hypothetical protein ACE366_25385 [Bradymonadia bacterium]
MSAPKKSKKKPGPSEKAAQKTPSKKAVGKGADDAPEVSPPQHQALAEAVEVFNNGNYRRAKAMLADVPADLEGDDARWRARLERAVTIDPVLLGVVGLLALVWGILFLRVN